MTSKHQVHAVTLITDLDGITTVTVYRVSHDDDSRRECIYYDPSPASRDRIAQVCDTTPGYITIHGWGWTWVSAELNA